MLNAVEDIRRELIAQEGEVHALAKCARLYT